MLVAGDSHSHPSAYGKAEKTVLIRDPLSLLPTLPRVVSPYEEIAVPVSVFVMKEGVRQVKISLQAGEHFELLGEKEQHLSFDEPGEKIILYHIRSRGLIGMGQLHFQAESGKENEESVINLAVQAPGSSQIQHQQQVLEPGESWTAQAKAFGLMGSNKLSLEVSSTLPLHLDARLNYLIRYPHGCIEQTTSSVLPQLALNDVMSLSLKQQGKIKTNINAAIERLQSFQTANGGFSYWPAGAAAHTWGSSYAGHFLLLAEQQAYVVPVEMRKAWLNFQQEKARHWQVNTDGTANQVYRLYTLALAGKPELGAMNRLKESKKLSAANRWRLAATYQLAGLMAVARELTQITPYSAVQRDDATFGSALRDQALMLDAIAELGDYQRGKDLADSIAKSLSSDRALNTQETAYALLAMMHYSGSNTVDPGFRFGQLFAGKEDMIDVYSNVYQHDLTPFSLQQDAKIRLTNDSEKRLYITLYSEGVPDNTTTRVSNAFGVSVGSNYTTREGASLQHIQHGMDVLATVTVRNLKSYTLKNLALM